MNIYSVAAEYAHQTAIYEASMLKSISVDINYLLLGIFKTEYMLKKPIFADRLDKDLVRFSEKETSLFFGCLRENTLDPVYAAKQLRLLLIKRGKTIQTDNAENKELKADEIRAMFGEKLVTLFDLMYEILKKRSEIIEILFDEMSIIPEKIIRDLRLRQEELNRFLKQDKEIINKKIDELQPSLNVSGKRRFLDKYGIDLTKKARDGMLDRIVGRRDEIKEIARILLQKQKGNPLLLGEPGVGKTAIVEGLAQQIVAPNAAKSIKKMRLIRIDIASLVAGAKYRGDFEQKLKSIVSDASADKNIILFIDEIHMLVGAGAGEAVGMDAANILKPALSKGEIRIIGATTTSEYKKYFEKDAALKRRFQTLMVKEPSAEETISMLSEIKKDFEDYHYVNISDGAIKQAVMLSIRFLPELRLPDKAIETIDRACSQLKLGTITDRNMMKGGRQSVTEDHIAAIIAKRSNLPVDSITAEMTDIYKNLKQILCERIAGHEEIINHLTKAIQKSKIGFKYPDKPVGVFLFMGPTGTGKTYLAECLAEILYGNKNKLIAFNMSEYNQPHMIATLLGSPPGYVGYQEEGLLSKRVGREPASVVLFDEIEKADHSVLDIFLQMFDKGVVVDASGKSISFTETIIILTSNINVSANNVKTQIGFHSNEQVTTKKQLLATKSDLCDELKKHIRPEIINRIENIMVFKPLKKEALLQIIDANIKEINKMLAQKGIVVLLESSAAEYIIQNSMTDEFGAREIKRTINKYIVEPVVQRLIEGNGGGILRKLVVDMSDGELVFHDEGTRN